jgi:glucokinase
VSSARRGRCILGIDVGGTNLRAGLYHPRTHALHCVRSADTEAGQGGAHALTRVVQLARQVVDSGKAQGLSVYRVGMGIPELVDRDGRVASASTLPWRAAHLRARLGPYGKLTLVSDVVAAALAEARLGAGRGQSVFLYISVGTGISCTLVIDGRPYRGAHGHALCFASGPTLATCEREGRLVFESLEARASGPGILARAQALGLQLTDARMLLRAAGDGPGTARDVVDAAATALATHVAILANALDPKLILLGGGLGCAPGRYAATFRAALPHYTYGAQARRVRVRRAQLGNRAGLIGAALCAVEPARSG